MTSTSKSPSLSCDHEVKYDPDLSCEIHPFGSGEILSTFNKWVCGQKHEHGTFSLSFPVIKTRFTNLKLS